MDKTQYIELIGKSLLDLNVKNLEVIHYIIKHCFVFHEFNIDFIKMSLLECYKEKQKILFQSLYKKE